MENSYSKYLEIIDHECLEHLDKLVEIREWIKDRIQKDRKISSYSKALDDVDSLITQLKSTL